MEGTSHTLLTHPCEEGPMDRAIHDAKYRRNNKEKRRISVANARAKKPEKYTSHGRAWKKKNPKRLAELNAAYRKRNRSKLNKKNRDYQKKNPTIVNAKTQRRRTAKTNAGGAYTSAQWIALCDKYGNACLCCHKKRKLTADHVIPVSKGGTSNIDNIQPLCGPCNSRKNIGTTDFRITFDLNTIKP
jgi:hypothetical protein